MSEQYVHIRYVGKWDRKVDNVLPRSGRVWPNQGACVRIPESEAYLYLRHPDEFELATPEFVASSIEAATVNAQQFEILLDLIPFISAEQCKALGDALAAREKQVAANGHDKTFKAPTPAEANEQSKRIKKIADVLPQMNKKDAKDFTAQGLPRLDRVRDLTRLTPPANLREVAGAIALLEKR